jgi:hypothetical protein
MSGDQTDDGRNFWGTDEIRDILTIQPYASPVQSDAYVVCDVGHFLNIKWINAESERLQSHTAVHSARVEVRNSNGLCDAPSNC